MAWRSFATDRLTDVWWLCFDDEARTMQTTKSVLGRSRYGLCRSFAIGLCVLPIVADLQAKTPKIEEKLDVVYEHRGGEPVLLDAYLLSGPGPHPAVVFVHGGGFVCGDKPPCLSYILAPFLEHGYSVVSVNYRLAPQHPFPAAAED